MSLEKQTDLWPAFEEADKRDKAKKWADDLEAANPGKTIGDIVVDRVHNYIKESEDKKHEAKVKESLEKYRNIGKPKEEPVEKVLPEEPEEEIDLEDEDLEDKDKEDPGYELYGRFEQFRK